MIECNWQKSQNIRTWQIISLEIISLLIIPWYKLGFGIIFLRYFLFPVPKILILNMLIFGGETSQLRFYLPILQVHMLKMTLLILYYIWHCFSRKIQGILFVFNFRLLWYSLGYYYLWLWVRWFINVPYFYLFEFFWLDTSS